MKLDINFTALETLVKNMDAPRITWKPIPTTPPPKPPNVWYDFLKRLTEGKEVVPIDKIEISPDGFVKYKGEQILLHIKEFNVFFNGRPNSLPKFHFYECTTLEDMRNKGRGKRYVATQRKDGYFLIDKMNEGNTEHDVEIKLDVCKNCLNRYNQHYQKQYTVDNFDIAKFFEHFGNSQFTETPNYTDENAPVSGYTADWNEVSKQRKEQCGYICQQCGVNLSNYKNLIHTHHANGVKSDNTSSNLKVLCIECHSDQPSHEHIKSNALHDILEVQRIKAIHRF
jgi:hypothetical protein